MKKPPRLTAEHILYGIGIANALRLAWAYATADAGGNVISLPGFFGLLMGAAVSIGTAFIAGKLAARLTKARKTLTWCAFIASLILEPIILAPITMTHMSVSVSTLLGPIVSWIWSVVLALVPSIVLAGVAVANGGLVEGSAQPAQSEGSGSLSAADTGSSKPASLSAKGKRIKQSLSSFPCPHAGAGCDVIKHTQQAINAHAGRCKYKPIAAMPEEVRIAQS